MRIHLYVNGSSMMRPDAYPEHGHAHKKTHDYTIQFILVDDIDA